MIRVNRETDLGMVILTAMARQPGRQVNAGTLAEERGLPQPMVSKILKHLTRAGVLVSHRGPKGGYGLARAPEAITVAEVIEALEGPIAFTECVEAGPEACRYSDNCNTSANWTRISRIIERALGSITLKDMCEPVVALRMMSPPGMRDHSEKSYS